MSPSLAAKRLMLQVTLSQVARFLSRSSVHTLIRLTGAAEHLAPTPKHRAQIAWLRERFEEGHPATRLAMRVLEEAHPNCRRALVNNLFVNGVFIGERQRRAIQAKEGWLPPFLMVISPSMRCNLNCYGCYAWEYHKKDQLSAETFDSILAQLKELGIYFVTISGGEPFYYAPLLDMAAKYHDMLFHVYTNGTLIDEKAADRIVQLGNIIPAISVEGFREETDERRGPGTYDRIMAAMSHLRERGGIYGFSCTVTRHNADRIMSPEFVDHLVDQGCYFGWYFIYIPIGRHPDLDLMPTPEQRSRLREWTLELRRTRPIFVADFWNDGPLTCGCMAGGRLYAHINNRGDVEPCVFAHFAVDNIHRTSLRQALNSEFFQAIRASWPHNPNPLRPCMIIDNPHILRRLVSEHHAHDTDGGGQALLEEAAPALDAYAAAHGKIADAAWESGYEWAKQDGLLDLEHRRRQHADPARFLQ